MNHSQQELSEWTKRNELFAINYFYFQKKHLPGQAWYNEAYGNHTFAGDAPHSMSSLTNCARPWHRAS